MDALDQGGRTARKAFDASGPLGPWIETAVDPTDIDMHTDVAGERRQEANTELMLFDPYEIIAFLSRRFTFRPGDVISFGSPANPASSNPATPSRSLTRASARSETRSWTRASGKRCRLE